MRATVPLASCGTRGAGRAALISLAALSGAALGAVAALSSFSTAALSAESGIALALADWVPKQSNDGWWGAVASGGSPDKAVRAAQQSAFLALPPGSYDLYWVQEYETGGRPMRLAAGVKVEAGQPTEFRADSGIALAVAAWVPARDNDGWWGAVASGARPDARVNWSKKNQALLLPPGSYDLYWAQDYATGGRPMLLAAGIKVEAGHAATINADSGIRLAVAPWVPKLDNDGWWGAVATGARPDARINWTKSNRALLLPPGNYDLYWVQDYERGNRPMLLAPGVAVEAGRATEVRADSGITLASGTSWTPRGNDGWWGAVVAGGTPDKPLNWTKTNRTLLLPPGRYDVLWKLDYSSDPERRLQGIVIAGGALVAVDLTRGQTAASAAAAPPAQPPSNRKPAGPAAGQAVATSGDSGLATVVMAFRLVDAQGQSVGPALAKGIHEVQAEYVWQDAKIGTPLGVDWYWHDDKIMTNGEPVATASGNVRWRLKMSAGGELPEGNYKVVLIENGKPGRTIAFTIGQVATAPAPAAAAPPPPGTGSGGMALAVDMVVRAWGLSNPAAGALVDSDDFDKPDPAWPIAEHADSKSSIVDGRYRMFVTGDSSTVIFRGPSQPFEDDLVEVDAWPKGGAGILGFYVRWQNVNNTHMFLLNATEGHVFAVHFKDGRPGFDTPLSPLPPGIRKARGEAYHLRLAALGEHLVFYVDGVPVATALALWPTGKAGLTVVPDKSGSSEVDFGGWRVRRLAAASPATAMPAPEANAAGFPIPSLEGFKKTKSFVPDEFKDTGVPATVEIFAAPNNDEIMRFTSGDTVWGYGWLPAGDAAKGYFLRDKTCSGSFTEKLPPDAKFGVPDCLVQKIKEKGKQGSIAPGGGPSQPRRPS
jgi:hypothetical protein